VIPILLVVWKAPRQPQPRDVLPTQKLSGHGSTWAPSRE